MTICLSGQRHFSYKGVVVTIKRTCILGNSHKFYNMTVNFYNVQLSIMSVLIVIVLKVLKIIPKEKEWLKSEKLDVFKIRTDF